MIIPRPTTRVTDFLGEEKGQKTEIRGGGGAEAESIREVGRRD